MRRTIRRGLFETNSSNTHIMTICNQEDYQKWNRGELLCRVMGRGDFLPVEEGREKNIEYLQENYDESFKPEDIEAYRKGDSTLMDLCEDFYWDSSDFYLSEQEFDDILDERCLEFFDQTATVEGIKVTAFGAMGREG